MPVSAKVAAAYIEFVAQTETFKKACNEAGVLVKQTSAKMRADMTEAKGSIALLGEEIGVHLPRHLRTFVAELPGVSTAMSAAFNAVAIFALASVIIETGKKVYEFAQKNEEAARKNAEAWEQSRAKLKLQNDELELSTVKLENQVAKLQHKPENKLAEALIEARVEAERLDEKLQASMRDAQQLLEKQSVGFLKSLWTGRASTGYEQTMVGEHLKWLGQATTPEAMESESKSFAKSLETRLNELETMQSRERTRLSYQPEIDAVKELQARQQAELATIQLTMRHSAAETAKDTAEGSAKDKGVITLDLGKLQDDTVAMFTKIRDDNAAFYKKLDDDAKTAFSPENVKGFTNWLQSQAISPFNTPYQNPTSMEGVAALFQGSAPNVKLQISAMEQLKETTLELAQQFTNLGGMLSNTFVRTLEQFNDTFVRVMAGDHRASFRQLGSSAAMGLSRDFLQYAEGSVMKSMFGVGNKKADGSGENPFWVIVKNGVEKGAAVPGNLAGVAGKGVLGMLNDSNWFSSLFGGRVFGAGGIFGGGHALGGDVAAGVPIDVGELGRERFTPMVPGRITRNSDLRGGNTWNIDARGTDPALTRENFVRALAMSRTQGAQMAMHAMTERSRRLPHG